MSKPITLQLSISATNLPNVSVGFKDASSPFGVVTMLSTKGIEESTLLGITEVIENTLNPTFSKTFFATYEDGDDKPCYILVKIIDEVYDQSFREMGVAIFDLRSILNVEGKTLTKRLKNGGCLNLHGYEAIGFDKFKLKLSGNDFVNARGVRKKCHPFYQFSRKDEKNGDERKIVHTSQKFYEHSLNPCWETETIDVFKFASGNFNQPLLLSVFHYKSNGKHVLIGELETSLNDLVSAGKLESSPSLKMKKKDFQTGSINVDMASFLCMTTIR